MCFDRSQKYLGVVDEKEHETRHPMDDLNGINAFADEVRETVRRYST